MSSPTEEVKAVVPDQPLTEEQMKMQEEEDDADLKALKEKLKRLEKKQPTDKDELIKHLMERLEQAEQAIE